MLVTVRARIARWLPGLSFGPLRAAALLMVGAVLLVAPYVGSGTELVRVRNALLLGEDFVPSQDWAPPHFPPDFLRETVQSPPYFVAIARQLNIDALPDDWSRALAISQHLLGSAPALYGGPVQRNLEQTHRAIVELGSGYCGDFVRIFTAIANAAGMTVRPWAFSFDGFGGDGHVWIEVWNRQRREWQLVGIFDNVYFVNDSHSGPLSALEVRRSMRTKDPSLQLRPLTRSARPGFEIEAKAWEYYSRGRDEWYVPWGNNVFTVDSTPAARLFSGTSRSLEQLGAVLAQTMPPIRMLAEDVNVGQRAAMRSLRLRLHGAAALVFAGLVLIAVAAARSLLCRRQRSRD